MRKIVRERNLFHADEIAFGDPYIRVIVGAVRDIEIGNIVILSRAGDNRDIGPSFVAGIEVTIGEFPGHGRQIGITVRENRIETDAAKRAEKKKKRSVTVEENGQTVTKEVSLADANKLRLELARKREAELHKDERTTPLNKEQ